MNPALIIRKSTISELEAAQNFDALLSEYAAECAIDGLPTPAIRVEIYKKLESINLLQFYAAFLDDLLVGFITVLALNGPHYQTVLGTTESFFVGKQYRQSGAGLKLLAAGEQHAKEIGAPGLLVSAPTGGSLAAVLEGKEYVETNRVFFKRFA